MENITVRTLKKSDQTRLKNMLFSYVDKVGDETILDIISSASTTGEGGKKISEAERRANLVKVFMELAKKLVTHLTDEMNAFFAELIGVTPDEYQDLPIDIDIRILEQIRAQPEVENFFTGALRLYNVTDLLKRKLQTLKDKYDSATSKPGKKSKA